MQFICQSSKLVNYIKSLQELDSAFTNLARDSVYDDPWSNKIMETLHRKGYVKVNHNSVILYYILNYDLR